MHLSGARRGASCASTERREMSRGAMRTVPRSTTRTATPLERHRVHWRGRMPHAAAPRPSRCATRSVPAAPPFHFAHDAANRSRQPHSPASSRPTRPRSRWSSSSRPTRYRPRAPRARRRACARRAARRPSRAPRPWPSRTRARAAHRARRSHRSNHRAASPRRASAATPSANRAAKAHRARRSRRCLLSS